MVSTFRSFAPSTCFHFLLYCHPWVGVGGKSQILDFIYSFTVTIVGKRSGIFQTPAFICFCIVILMGTRKSPKYLISSSFIVIFVDKTKWHLHFKALYLDNVKYKLGYVNVWQFDYKMQPQSSILILKCNI